MKRAVTVVILLLAALSADAKPKKKAAPAHVEPVAAPVVVVPASELRSARADGLRFIQHRVPGSGVSARLFIRLDPPIADHPARSAALVTAASALWSGPAGDKLSAAGAGRSVDVVGTCVVLGMDTIRERWKDDLGTMLDAISAPQLSEQALERARLRVTPLDPPSSIPELRERTMADLVPRDVSLMLTAEQPDPVTLDGAVWHLEEMWTADRMVLVVTGDLPPAEVTELVDARFLVPGALQKPAKPVDEARPFVDTVHTPPPAAYVYGQWARGVPVQDALVLAALLDQVVRADSPAAGECSADYVPDAREPAIVVVCAGLKGEALDVKNTMTRALDAATLVAPTTAQWEAARKLAVARLGADDGSSARTAMRLGRFASAGWDAGPSLAQAIQTVPESSLQSSLATLLGAGRNIRIQRSATE